MSDTTTTESPADSGDDLRSVLSAAYEASDAPAEQPTERTDDRHRDDQGRFAARDATETPPAEQQTETTAPQPEVTAETQPEPVKATETPTQQPEIDGLRRVLEPYRAKHAMMGMSDAEAVGRLLAAEQQLRDNPVAAFKELARAYGVDVRQLVQPQEHQTNQQGQPDVIQYVDQRFAQQQQADQQRQAASQVEAFAADPKHPHFTEVRLHMGALLNAGAAKDMEEAYQQAVWANPTVRERVLAEQRKADDSKRTTEAREKADAARKAGVSIKGAPSGPSTSAAPPAKSLREELERAYG